MRVYVTKEGVNCVKLRCGHTCCTPVPKGAARTWGTPMLSLWLSSLAQANLTGGSHPLEASLSTPALLPSTR